jgi:hypothetical protein
VEKLDSTEKPSKWCQRVHAGACSWEFKTNRQYITSTNKQTTTSERKPKQLSFAWHTLVSAKHARQGGALRRSRQDVLVNAQRGLHPRVSTSRNEHNKDQQTETVEAKQTRFAGHVLVAAGHVRQGRALQQSRQDVLSNAEQGLCPRLSTHKNNVIKTNKQIPT